MVTGYLNFREEELSRDLTEYYRIMLSYYGTELAPLHLLQKAVHCDAVCCCNLPGEQPDIVTLIGCIQDEVYVIPVKDTKHR